MGIGEACLGGEGNQAGELALAREGGIGSWGGWYKRTKRARLRRGPGWLRSTGRLRASDGGWAYLLGQGV